MIFQIPYVVDHFLINAYIAFPNWLFFEPQELPEIFASRYKIKQPSIKQVSYSIQKKTEPINNVKLPALLYCRGGIKNQGKVKMEWLEQFTSHGYVVFAPTYRGNEGSQGRDEFGGSDRNDTYEAFRLLESLPFVDKERISVMGFSRGAINATQTAIAVKKAKHLILWGGVSNLTNIYETRVDLRRMFKRVIGTTPYKNITPYEERSPIKMAADIPCPTLIIHGTQDVQVPFSEGENMYHELRGRKKPVTLHHYEGYGHHFPLPVHLFAVERMFGWMKHH